jgi:hypothetical protein
MVFAYGNEKPSASGICSNVREVNISGSLVDGKRFKEYDLICSTSGRLYFGDDENGSYSATSTASRPVQIDTTNYLIQL